MTTSMPLPGDDDPPPNLTKLPVPDAPAVPSMDYDSLAGESVELGWGGRLRIWILAQILRIPYWIGLGARRMPRWLWWLLRDPLIGTARVAVVAFRWLHLAEEREAIRKMESADAKAKAKRDVNKDGRFRLIVSAILLGVAVAIHLTLIYGWPVYDDSGARVGTTGRYAGFVALEFLGLFGLLVWLGHKPRTDPDSPVRRRGPLSHGTSSRSLRRDLEEGFASKKMADVGVIGLTVNKFGWHGSFETEQVIDDKLIEHLERWVHAPEGSLLVTVDDRNAAAHPFKLLIEDPLTVPSVPELPESPRDIRKLATIGRHLFGMPLRVNLRQHIGLIGRSGSGKSSGFWILLDWVTSCFNAEAVGIDLSQGPALPAWRRAMLKVGTTAEEAEEILVEAITLAQERNAELARRAEDDDDDSDENWDPTPSAKARFVFLDEFHLTADNARLLALVKTLIRIGRKACIFLVIGTPGASKEDVGSVVIKGMIGLKILFACIQQDVTNFLGGKMVEQGWRPDKLKPSASEDNPRDAGKAYLWDGAHQDPEVVRISRLSLSECKQRARARASVTPSGASDGPKDSAAVAIVRDVMEQAGLDKISLGWLENLITIGDYDMGYDRVRAELGALGITTRRVNKGAWPEANPHGYFLSDLG